MTPARRFFDLAIIGADGPGLAAAACAAKAGASVVLIRTGRERPEIGARATPPNAVWRMLDLQNTGFDPRPVSARISLFEDGTTFASHRASDRMKEALGGADPAAARVWPDFAAMLSRLGWSSEMQFSRPSGIAGAAPRGDLTGLLAGLVGSAASPGAGSGALRRSLFDRFTRGPGLDFDPAATANDALDDFFTDEKVKTHLASVALSTARLAGDEPGSAAALADLVQAAAWPARAGAAGVGLSAAMEAACRAAGVVAPDARLETLDQAPDGSWSAILDDASAIFARMLIASSARAASAAGLQAETGPMPIRLGAGVDAFVRIRFDAPPEIAAGDPDAVHFVADGRRNLVEARDAMLEGELIDRPPVSFEVVGGDIFLSAPYCPVALREGGGLREWSGQDKQAFGATALSRIAPFLKTGRRHARQIDVRLFGPGAPRGRSAEGVRLRAPAPTPTLDDVSAAAELALRTVRHG